MQLLLSLQLSILLNGQPVDALSSIVHKSKAERRGRELALRLKEVIDRCVLKF